MINTKGIEQHKVLKALYNHAKAQGLGWLNFKSAPMSDEEAKAFLKERNYFDYLKGRVIKVNLKDQNGFEERLYDRDNGPGAAQSAIDSIDSNKF